MAVSQDTALVTGAALLCLVGSLALWLWAWRQLAHRRGYGQGIAGGSFTLFVGVLLLALNGGDPAYYPLIGLSLSLVVLGVWYALAEDLEITAPSAVASADSAGIAARPTPTIRRVALKKTVSDH